MSPGANKYPLEISAAEVYSDSGAQCERLRLPAKYVSCVTTNATSGKERTILGNSWPYDRLLRTKCFLSKIDLVHLLRGLPQRSR